MSAKGKIATGSSRGCGDPVRQNLHQRGKYSLGNALADLGCTAGNRARILGIKKCVSWPDDFQRLKSTGTDRNLGEDMPDSQID